jgi:hypothetical protein
LSSEMRYHSCADPFRIAGRQHRSSRYGERRTNTAESQTLCMSGTFKRENREVLVVSITAGPPRPARWNGQSTFQTGLLT